MSGKRLLDVAQVAEYLGIAKHTMARWRVEGSGPPFIRLGSRVKYSAEDLDLWIESQRRRSTSEQLPGAGRA